MQTSIEWLIKSLSDRMYIHCPEFGHTIIDKLIEQAKEMHKQEIIDAQSYAVSNADMTDNKGYFDCDKYYQETFKKDSSKEQQKRLIIEIMDLDAKDGLYEHSVSPTYTGESPFPKQKTLYTEEQVRKVIEQSYSLGSAYRGVYSKKLENEIIQSLK